MFREPRCAGGQRLALVLQTCLLLVSAHAFAALTVEIVAPETDPYATLPGDETEFLAVAYVDGEQCGDEEVTLLWDFGDDGTSTDNPALHAYDDTGNYTVTVTATCGELQAQDSMSMVIEADTQATPGYTLELEPPDPDGTICDIWTLKLTAPSAGYEAVSVVETWHRHNGGPWILNQHVNLTGVSPTCENGKRVFRGPWFTWSCPNLSCQVYCKLRWVGSGPPPPPSGYAYTNKLKATPKNTVVKAWADLDQGQLIFYDPECTDASINHPKIDWNAIHRQWPDPVGTQHFDWQTSILDLGGGTIRSLPGFQEHGFQQNPGTGDTTWDGSRDPPASTAGLGIYTFQVMHTHVQGTHSPGCYVYGFCVPQLDKPGALSIDDVSVSNVGFAPNVNLIYMNLTYSLSRLASVCRATLYAANEEKRAAHQNPFERIGNRVALPRGAGTHEVSLDWPKDPRPYRWFWLAVEAKENSSIARLYNRDHQPKWAIPKGVALPFPVVAWDIAHNGNTGQDEPWIDIAEAAAEQQTTLADGTGYDSHTGAGMDATTAAGKFEKSALWYFVGHGGAGYVNTRDTFTDHTVTLFGRMDPPPESPPHDRIDQHNLTPCLLVVFDTCGSGTSSSWYGLLPDIAVQRGADCAVGFDAPVWSGTVWTNAFWGSLAQDSYEGEPLKVSRALQTADRASPGSHSSPVVYGTDLSIRPARYGNP